MYFKVCCTETKNNYESTNSFPVRQNGGNKVWRNFLYSSCSRCLRGWRNTSCARTNSRLRPGSRVTFFWSSHKRLTFPGKFPVSFNISFGLSWFYVEGKQSTYETWWLFFLFWSQQQENHGPPGWKSDCAVSGSAGDRTCCSNSNALQSV